MRPKIIPLRERVRRLEDGFSSDREYTALLAVRLANSTLEEYMQGHQSSLDQLVELLAGKGIHVHSTLADAAYAIRQIELSDGRKAANPLAQTLACPMVDKAYLISPKLEEKETPCPRRKRPRRSKLPPMEGRVPLSERLARVRGNGDALLKPILLLGCTGYLEGFEVAGGVELYMSSTEAARAFKRYIPSMVDIAKKMAMSSDELDWVVYDFLIHPLAGMRDVVAHGAAAHYDIQINTHVERGDYERQTA